MFKDFLKSKPKYELIDVADKKNWQILIKSKKYNGVVFEFNSVKFVEIKERGICKVDFTYSIMEDSKDLVEDTQGFENYISKILEDIMKKEANDE